MHYIFDELFSKKELFILGLEDWEYRKINSEEIKTISGKEDCNGRLTLNHFPPGILELANLESIEFIGHKIPGIPSAVGCLKELKILNLESNEISGLVSRFFEVFIHIWLSLYMAMDVQQLSCIGRKSIAKTKTN